MFKCDQLIYIQMHKTGCTHIASQLSKLFEGDIVEKHNAATQSQLTSTQYFVSSIRNPWDWYLSLWTFGVQGNGALVHRLAKRKDFRRFLKTVIRHPIRSCPMLFYELSKDITAWCDVYDRSDNVESFRKWLKLIHNPGNSLCLGEGYEKTAITNLCGFMTYRYLYLCCKNVGKLKSPKVISSYADLIKFESENCYIDFFIRQESLERDLCEAVEKVRPLSQEEKEIIYGARKANTSTRRLLISDYYDEESIELIRSRDRLLINKFNYLRPKIAEQSAVADG